MNIVIILWGIFLNLITFIFCCCTPADGGGGHGVGESSEAEGEARRSAPPEIVEQPPKEMAAVISEKLLIPLKATGAQLRYGRTDSACACGEA